MGMNKWTIRSIDSDEVDLVFTPTKVYDKVNNFMLVKSSLKQYIGKVSGVVKVSGEDIEIENILTWCEDHYAKW